MVLRHVRVTATLAIGQEQLPGFLARSLGVVLVTTAQWVIKVLAQIALSGARARGQALLAQDQKLALGAGTAGVTPIAFSVPGPKQLVDPLAWLRIPAHSPALVLRAEKVLKV